VIRRLRGRGLVRLYELGDRSGIRPDLLATVENILTLLEAAETPEALNLPRLRLHALRGNREGYWSVTVRRNWRLIFRFEDGAATDVELIDYH